MIHLFPSNVAQLRAAEEALDDIGYFCVNWSTWLALRVPNDLPPQRLGTPRVLCKATWRRKPEI
jgi:hypothetical protein